MNPDEIAALTDAFRRHIASLSAPGADAVARARAGQSFRTPERYGLRPLTDEEVMQQPYRIAVHGDPSDRAGMIAAGAFFSPTMEQMRAQLAQDRAEPAPPMRGFEPENTAVRRPMLRRTMPR